MSFGTVEGMRMTVHEQYTTRQKSQGCPCVAGVASACAGFIEGRAIGDLAALLNSAATQSGLGPQDLLECISDEALAGLYLSCAADVRARAATAMGSALGNC
jgi:hypothetical protein